MRGVVSGESPAAWPAEALKAQAVAARTYAITTDAGGAVFDQYADTRSQVYRGVAAETPNTDAAVAATTGQVVTYDGQPVTTYFFSTSGGETEDVENSFVGSQPEPWLKAVDDPFDSVSPKHRWGPFRFTATQVKSKLHRYLRGTLQAHQGPAARRLAARRARAGRRHARRDERDRAAAALGLRPLRHVGVLHDGEHEGEQAQDAEARARAGRRSARAASRRRARGRGAGAPRVEGTIAPARAGRWLTVQRLDGRRWVRRRTRVLRGGRYSVACRGRACTGSCTARPSGPPCGWWGRRGSEEGRRPRGRPRGASVDSVSLGLTESTVASR